MNQVTARLTDEEMARFLEYRKSSGFDSNGLAAHALLMIALDAIASSNPIQSEDRITPLERQVQAVTTAIEELRAQMQSLIATPVTAEETPPTLDQIKEDYGLVYASQLTEQIEQIEQIEHQPAIKDVDWQEISKDQILARFPDFWTYMVIRSERRNDTLRQKGKNTPDPEDFALEKIREDGKKFFDEFDADLPTLLTVSADGIKTHMEFLNLDWNSEVIKEWLSSHLLYDFNPKDGVRGLPDWARFRLAYDLEKMAKEVNNANKL